MGVYLAKAPYSSTCSEGSKGNRHIQLFFFDIWSQLYFQVDKGYEILWSQSSEHQKEEDTVAVVVIVICCLSLYL